MARSHHRKKHKAHLRQYQQSHEGGTVRIKKSKVSGTFAIVGTVLGAAVGYFSTNGNATWIGFGAVIGGLAGYLTGRYFDRESTRS